MGGSQATVLCWSVNGTCGSRSLEERQAPPEMACFLPMAFQGGAHLALFGLLSGAVMGFVVGTCLLPGVRGVLRAQDKRALNSPVEAGGGGGTVPGAVLAPLCSAHVTTCEVRPGCWPHFQG